MNKINVKPTKSSTKEVTHRMIDGERFCDKTGIIKYFYNISMEWFNTSTKANGALYCCEEKTFYEQLKWFEDIPEQGVLCWVWNDRDGDNKSVVNITNYWDGVYFDDKLLNWYNAVPITKEEMLRIWYDE